jgi:hypothetical protein
VKGKDYKVFDRKKRPRRGMTIKLLLADWLLLLLHKKTQCNKRPQGLERAAQGSTRADQGHKMSPRSRFLSKKDAASSHGQAGHPS